MTEPDAEIHIVGAQAGSDEFLKQVTLLGGRFGRRYCAEGVTSIFFFYFLKFFGDKIQGLVPGGFLELSVLLNQRGLQPVRAVDKVHTETAFYTKVAFVDGVFIFYSVYLDDFVVLGPKFYL